MKYAPFSLALWRVALVHLLCRPMKYGPTVKDTPVAAFDHPEGALDGHDRPPLTGNDTTGYTLIILRHSTGTNIISVHIE